MAKKQYWLNGVWVSQEEWNKLDGIQNDPQGTTGALGKALSWYSTQAKRADAAARHSPDMSLKDRFVGNLFKELESAFLPKGIIGSSLKAHLRSASIDPSQNDIQNKSGINYKKLNSDDVIKVMNSNAQQTIKATNTINSTFITNFNRLSRENRERDLIFDGMARTQENQLLRLTEIRDFFDKEGYTPQKPGNGQYMGKDGKIMDEEFYDSSKNKEKQPSLINRVLEDAGILGGLEAGWGGIKGIKSVGSKIVGGITTGAGAIGESLMPALRLGGPMVALEGLATLDKSDTARENDDATRKWISNFLSKKENKWISGGKNSPPRLNPNYHDDNTAIKLPNISPSPAIPLINHTVTSLSAQTNRDRLDTSIGSGVEEKLKNEGYRVKTENAKTDDSIFTSRTITYKADKIIFDSPFISIPGIGGSSSSPGQIPIGNQSTQTNNQQNSNISSGASDSSVTPNITPGEVNRNYNRDRQGGDISSSGPDTSVTPSMNQRSSGHYDQSTLDKSMRGRSGGGKGGKLSQNQQIAYNTLRQEGLNDTQSKAWVANMSGEALATPSNYHWDVHHMSGGIMQWDPTRAEKIKKQFGKYPWESDVATQTKMAVWEAKSGADVGAHKAWNTLMNPKSSSADMIHSLVHDSERSANPTGDTTTRQNIYKNMKINSLGDPIPNTGPIPAAIDPATGQPTGHGLRGPDSTAPDPIIPVNKPTTIPLPEAKKVAAANSQNNANIGKELNRRSQDVRLNAIRRQTNNPPVIQNINNHTKHETSTTGGRDHKKTVPAFDDMFMKLLANSPMNA